MIVVEGPDGGGKTQLATRLSEELGIPIHPKIVSNEAKALGDLKAWVEETVTVGFDRRIYDRHAVISELIYSPAMGQQWKHPFENRAWTINALTRFYRAEPFIVYCMPPLPTVWDNVQNDDTSKVVQNPELIERIYKLYEARIAVDMALAQGVIRVWDYVNDEGFGYFESIVAQIRNNLSLRGFHADAR